VAQVVMQFLQFSITDLSRSFRLGGQGVKRQTTSMRQPLSRGRAKD
jgi:hypothetical protein